MWISNQLKEASNRKCTAASAAVLRSGTIQRFRKREHRERKERWKGQGRPRGYDARGAERYALQNTKRREYLLWIQPSRRVRPRGLQKQACVLHARMLCLASGIGAPTQLTGDFNSARSCNSGIRDGWYRYRDARNIWESESSTTFAL